MTTTKDQVIQAVEDNHIWVNAFLLINPTDDIAKDIGYTVIGWLKNRDNLLPKLLDAAGETDPEVRESLESLAKLTPTLYMSVNAS